MNPATPPHAYTAAMKRFVDPHGNYCRLMAVQFNVPSRVEAMLSQSGDIYHIPCASIGEASNLETRANSWRKPFRLWRKLPLRPALHTTIPALIEEGCDTPILIALSKAEWQLVGVLCGMLRITPGQWFLACAGYNAAVEEERISRMLESIPSAIA